MPEVFLSTLSPMLVLFFCLLIGFILNKTKVLPDSTATVLSRLETYVFMPALVFSTFMKHCTISSIYENTDIFPYSLIAIAFVMILSVPLSKLFERNDLYKRNIFKYALVFANHGFMGNAIVPIILGGNEHLYKYLLFTLPLNFMTYIWGITILTPYECRSGNFLKNFINMPMLGLLLGMIVGLSGAYRVLPEFLITSVDYLQGCMGPVAMLLSGFIIGNYRFEALLKNTKIYIMTMLRLIVLPALILILLHLLGAGSYILNLAFFAYATPLGLNTIVIPASFDSDTETGASMTMISHILCVLTIPLLYTLFQIIINNI